MSWRQSDAAQLTGGGTHSSTGEELEDLKATRYAEGLRALGLVCQLTTTAASAGPRRALGGRKQRPDWEKASLALQLEKADPRYPPKSGRGTIKGTVTYTDAASAYGVRLQRLGGAGESSGQRARQFRSTRPGTINTGFTPTDKGIFSLPNVRPGSYTLHAFVAGIHGVYIGQDNAVVVTAGGTTDLGAC